MIVCLCRGVTEREIVEAARTGAASVEDIGRVCKGAGADCGSCRATIREVITASQTDRAA
jgi:bacterioferritin-associated ferredoxin